MTPSVRADNHYTFLCPTTGRTERYLACVFRRHRHWRGESVEDGDCTTCMNAGKCAAVKMIDEECRENKAIYFDATPGRVRKLPQVALDRVALQVILPCHAQGQNITRARLEELMGNKMSAEHFAQMQAAQPAPERKARKMTPNRSFPADMSLAKAAEQVTTDMASAINQAIEGDNHA